VTIYMKRAGFKGMDTEDKEAGSDKRCGSESKNCELL
jgi:hypothetical protein